MPRVSQDQLDARRHEILSAARACFARFGYEGATVRRLEEATGMSRGAIFHHFRDKESLFLAVAEDDAALRNRDRKIEVRALRRGVNSGVGAAGGVHAYRRAADARERFLDHLLHTARIRLRLPPGVARAEILKGEKDAHGVGAVQLYRSTAVQLP